MKSVHLQNSATLPYEILAEIVAWYVAKFGPANRGLLVEGENGDLDGRQNGYLSALSLASKTFNKICSEYIFSTCILTIRTLSDKQVPTMLFPEDNMWGTAWPWFEGYVKWNAEAVPLRIAHVASKAEFIRELYIRDRYTACIPTLPDCIIPELCRALESMKRLSAVRIRCLSGSAWADILPSSLWDTLATLNLKTLDIKGFGPPLGNLRPMYDVQDVAFDWSEETAGFMRLFDPVSLTVHYTARDSKPLPPLLVPTSRRLRRLKAKYSLLPEISQEILFDFTEVLQASIEVRLIMVCDDHLLIPRAFQTMTRNAMYAFADGIEHYNVRRLTSSELLVTRPALKWADFSELEASRIDVQPDFVPTMQMQQQSEEEFYQEIERMNSFDEIRRPLTFKSLRS